MNDVIITVRDASVRFNLAMQQQMSLKQHVGRLLRKNRQIQEFFALRHINLEVRRGESWGFVGRNGSGKSTLLKLVTGILSPWEGSAPSTVLECSATTWPSLMKNTCGV